MTKKITATRGGWVWGRRGFGGEEQANGLGEGPSGAFLVSTGMGGEGL